MKKIQFIFLLALSVIVISCGDDDSDSINVNESDLAGTWILVEYNAEQSYDGEFNGVTFDYSNVQEGSNFDNTVTFFTDPNTFESDGGFDITVTTTFQGQTTTETIEGSSFYDDELSADGSWSVNGDTFTATDGETSTTAKIIFYDGDKITFKLDFDDLEGLDEIPFALDIEGEIIYSLERVN